ncbi:MAG: hypothetical protein IJ864_04335 [Alphaproteobacteria bacterium]|nr:hypothetical protein [Alphaproteobacteria bacterium]
MTTRIMEKKYFMAAAVCVILSSCNAAFEEVAKPASQPGETVLINRNTETSVEVLDTATYSGWCYGWSTLKAEGVIKNEVTEGDDTPVISTNTVGGSVRSDGELDLDTVRCGESFIDAVFRVVSSETRDVSTEDSIGTSKVQMLAATDGQTGRLLDSSKYVAVETTGTVPHYEGSSEVARVSYRLSTDSTRIVDVLIRVTSLPVGGVGTPVVQEYTMSYVQLINLPKPEPEPEPTPVEEPEVWNWQVVFDLRTKTSSNALYGIYTFTSNKGQTFSWEVENGRVGRYNSSDKLLVASVAPLPVEPSVAFTEQGEPKTFEIKKVAGATATETSRTLTSKFATKFATNAGGEVQFGNNVNYIVRDVQFTMPNGQVFTFTFTPETVLREDVYNAQASLVGKSHSYIGATYVYNTTLTQSADHYIYGQVTVNGKTTALQFDCLQDGKTLKHNEGSVDLFVTK